MSRYQIKNITVLLWLIMMFLDNFIKGLLMLALGMIGGSIWYYIDLEIAKQTSKMENWHD